jgi:transposase
MFIKLEKVKLKSGEVNTHVCVVEAYRDALGKPKQRRIKLYGCLEKQSDPKAFMDMVKAELPLLENQVGEQIKITIGHAENKIDASLNDKYNFGYKYLESIYNALKLDNYFEKLQAEIGGKIEYSISDIFKFLVFKRILKPDSKRATLQYADSFLWMNSSFSLDDVYRCMTLISSKFNEIQDYIKIQSDKLINRDYSKIYYDCTNYYCEIDFSDTIENLRHRGVSKEHRVDPIVGLGLFLDNNGLPLKCQVFNGNIAESKTLIPGIQDIKKAHQLSHVVMVCDKGLNTSINIEELVKNGDGYVFSQTLRGNTGKRFHEHIFNDTGYDKTFNEFGQVERKYKTIEEDYTITDTNGNKVTTRRKVLIYYSLKEDMCTKRKRAEKLLRAENSLRNNIYSVNHGFEQYIKTDQINKVTGEILTNTLKKSRSINLDKVENDAKFDGYFCIITSELNYSAQQIREAYSQLWEIEQTFRITKTDLEFRPIYHYKRENIMSHFLICYCAVFILRMYQFSLREKGVNISTERIIKVLNGMMCKNLKENINIDQPESTESAKDFKAINSTFGISLEQAFYKTEAFKNILKKISKHFDYDKKTLKK